jgi:ankyrin
MAALHFAARDGAFEGVRALAVAPGIDLNITDPDGTTPLLFAALNGHFDVAAYLLQAGADPNLGDVYGRTPLFAALDMATPEETARPLPRRPDKTTAMKFVRLAVSKGADPNAPITGRIPGQCGQGCSQAAVEGATPIWRAARSANAEAVRLLLAAGADPEMPSRTGDTPLMLAAGLGYHAGTTVGSEAEALETVKALLDAGVEINAVNSKKETALHSAADRAANDIVRFLVEHGARLDLKDKLNRTPYDIANGLAEPPSMANGYKEPYVRPSTRDLLRELMTAQKIPIPAP